MNLIHRIQLITAKLLVLTMFFGNPGLALAQDATETGAPQETGTPEEQTGAPDVTGAEDICTGAGCGQGAGQGADQGSDQGTTTSPTDTSSDAQGADQGAGQGGTSLEDLGGYVDEEGNTILPDGVEDTRQGAAQGASQGDGNNVDLSGSNTNTGADSDNTVDADVDDSQKNSITNIANDTSDIDGSANTGANTSNANTDTGGITSGNANIGVTQVKQDNTVTKDGNVGLSVAGHEGDYDGDVTLDFEQAIALLTGAGDSRSLRAINDTTGEGSANDIILSTRFEELNEIQNDGNIDNDLNLEAITGQNEANKNTGDGSITTGDANIAATLVNLLNTTVLNGNVSVSVQDIFGNLNGNIVIPDLAQIASFLTGGGHLDVEAENDTTGSDSVNDIDIDVTDTETTNIDNDADIDTNVTADVITGQNDTLKNTGGGEIDTGDASVSASNVSIANTTVEGGSWGLVIVNALNRWAGYLVGDNGETRALSQSETLREIEARNSNTGADSDNTIDIDDETVRTDNIENDATINNNIFARAITGQNEANKNTGKGEITTGDANVLTTAVNIANTTVKNANLGIAVVNVFGNWLGDIIYDGVGLLAAAGSGQNVAVDAGNNATGSDSENTIDVNVDKTQETNIDNDADIDTTLNVNIDTGNNRANSNTLGGDVETGEGFLALHSRAIANVTGISGPHDLSVSVDSGNTGTGADSENRIRANVNDERVLNINNQANVSTVLPGTVNTGNNQANRNTVGGNIDTGNIDANVEVHNVLNRLLVALGSEVPYDASHGVGANTEVDAEFLNRLTGAFSENENAADVARTFLADIVNDAVVETILDLLLNTGGNQANENTTAYLGAAVAASSDAEASSTEEHDTVAVAASEDSETTDEDSVEEENEEAVEEEDEEDEESDSVFVAASVGGGTVAGSSSSSSASTTTIVAAEADGSGAVVATSTSVTAASEGEATTASYAAATSISTESGEEVVAEQTAPTLALDQLRAQHVSKNDGNRFTMFWAMLAGLVLAGVVGGIAFWSKRQLAFGTLTPTQ